MNEHNEQYNLMNSVNSVNDKINNTTGLDKGSKKFVCPGCGQRTFVKMKNFNTGEYLPDHVGRCDRENNCGYHFTVKQYLSELSLNYYAPPKQMLQQIVEKPIDVMPLEYVEGSMNGYNKTNFANWLTTLFRNRIAEKALLKYFVGRSKRDAGKATIFWRIDKDEKVRTGKIMCYNAGTGKRVKEINPSWVHSNLTDFNYQLCFFGEHLLPENDSSIIGIVESEKTAIIASIFMPDIVWLATGGNSGCKWREYAVYKVLKDRQVMLFPDFGYFNKKTQRTCFQEWNERANHIQEKIKCSIKVSRVLEDNVPESERCNDYDLADFLIKKCGETGLAMSDGGYPVLLDEAIYMQL